MAGFFLIKSPYESDVMEELPISSLTLAAGDMLMLAVGSTTWDAATSSIQHWQKKAVVQEAVGSSATTVKVIPVLPGQRWSVEVANTADAAHNGDRMVLTDSNTVNNTGTDNTGQTAVFIQRAINTTTNTTTAVGEFVWGSGVDPDAT